jgi:glycosyltransferase involved in cell wall biosynthesis
VIASAAAGNRDLITDDVDGLLVQRRDPEAWARAIERVLGNPAVGARLGESARKTARGTYALERTIERTARLYRAILGE